MFVLFLFSVETLYDTVHGSVVTLFNARLRIECLQVSDLCKSAQSSPSLGSERAFCEHICNLFFRSNVFYKDSWIGSHSLP